MLLGELSAGDKAQIELLPEKIPSTVYFFSTCHCCCLAKPLCKAGDTCWPLRLVSIKERRLGKRKRDVGRKWKKGDSKRRILEEDR